MIRMTPIFLALLVFQLGCQPVNANFAEKPRVQIDLIDGSRIVGTLREPVLRGRTQYGKLEIPLIAVQQVGRGTAGQLKILFSNGDELTLVPEFNQLNCETLFGEVRIKLSILKKLVVRSEVLKDLPATEHILLYYGFDQPEDLLLNQAQDALHATNHGGVWSEQGIFRGSAEFTGTGRIEIPHNPKLCPSKFSFAAWVFPTEPSSNYEMLIGKTQPSSWSGGYGICRMSGDQKHVRFFVNGYTSTNVSRRLPIRKWTHLACVVDESKIEFYVDGNSAKDVQRQNPTQVTEGEHPEKDRYEDSVSAAQVLKIQHTNAPLTLGGDPAHYGWKGRMDEFVFYNTALSADQIHQIYSIHAARRE